MRIAVNLLPFRERLAGAGRYAQNILSEILRADPHNEYVLLVTPRAAGHFEYRAQNVTRILVSLPPWIAARIAYEQLGLPLALRRRRVDVLFTPSVAIPLAGSGKRVTVIHDMIAEHRQVSKYPPLRRAYIRRMSRLAAERSDSVITVSEHTRRELAGLGVPAARIFVAPNAVDPRLRPVEQTAELERVRVRYQLPARFILYVGTLEPGKNLVRLVQAHRRLRSEHPQLDQELVIAGAAGWGMQPLRDEIRRDDRVTPRLTGYVEEQDLAAMYSLADLFVYPSLYEGFGLPPLEAMACGAPVVASNVSALPEVLGSAAELCTPTDVNDLAEAMGRVLKDAELGERMRQAGLARVKRYSWASSARVVLERLLA